MSAISKRLHYDTVSQFYAGSPDVILSESNLVLVQPLTATNTNYTYDVLVNEGTPLSYESRLAITDVFWASKMSFYVSDAGAAADDPEVQFLTYPNETLLGANFADWRNLYRGEWSITVNNVRYIQSLAGNIFYSIPQTQRINNAANQVFDQVDYHKDAVYDLTPSIQLSGAHKNEVTLTMPGAVTGAGANFVTAVILSGVVAIGGARYRS